MQVLISHPPDTTSNGRSAPRGGPGGAPRVLVLRGAGVLANLAGEQDSPLANFFVAGDSASRGGVRVLARDLDGDGGAELVVGSGEGTPGAVRVYATDGLPPPGSEPALRQRIDPFGTGSIGPGVFVG